MIAINRRSLIATAAAAGASTVLGLKRSYADDTRGVSATEIKIGSTTALSGPVSALGTMARCQAAYFAMVNDQGGIAGRKINFIYYDDAFNPSKTVEQTRRLVESDEVALLFFQLGTAPNAAIVKYVNARGVPHLFLGVNGDRWGDYKTHPWTMGFAPSSRIEAQIYAKYAMKLNPNSKFGILYQNDDLGKDYVAGVREVLADKFDANAKAIPYELSEPTINSQIVALRATGADVLITGGTSKFAAQAIRKVYELGWKPTHLVASGASGISSTIKPAGPEKAEGIISSAFLKDPSDPVWSEDAGVKEYWKFMEKYFAEGDRKEYVNLWAYAAALTLHKVLEQCNGEFSRKNIMLQANSLTNVALPVLIPGITVNTSPTDHFPIKQMQLRRWEGDGWKNFGTIIDGSAI